MRAWKLERRRIFQFLAVMCLISLHLELPFDVPDPAFIPERFDLMFKSDRMVRHCRIAWIMANRIGVVFEYNGGCTESLAITSKSPTSQ